MSGAHHLVLVGMMGSGKTTVGRMAAAALQRPFLDSDQMIEARQGRTVREIWLAEGEPIYRVMETEALAVALAAEQPAVIAAAGGVVLRQENRDLLRQPAVCTVRLQADPDVLVLRVGNQQHRPLLDGDPLAALHRLAAEREPLYAEVADATITVARRSVEDVTAEVLTILAGCEAS